MRRLITTVVATALVAAVLTAAPASAGTAPDRDLRRDGSHYPVSIKTTVPAGGSTMLTTPTLGKQVDTVKVTVKPQAGASDAQLADFDRLASATGKLTKGGRLLVCVTLFYGFASTDLEPGEVGLSGTFTSMALAVLGACLQLAGLIAQDQPAAARSSEPLSRAARPCGKAVPRVPAQVEKTDDGYTITAEGQMKKAKNPPLRVGCRVKGHRVVLKVRAAEKGASVRSVVGKKLSVGILSPPDAETGVPVKVTFATP